MDIQNILTFVQKWRKKNIFMYILLDTHLIFLAGYTGN